MAVSGTWLFEQVGLYIYALLLKLDTLYLVSINFGPREESMHRHTRSAKRYWAKSLFYYRNKEITLIP